MPTSVATAPMSHVSDDCHIRWYALGDFKHFVFAMLDVYSSTCR